MQVDQLTYYHAATPCKGFVAFEEKIEVRRPAVLVAHAWRGQDDFVRQKAIELAALGYVGFAVDIYGEGKSVTNEEAPLLMAPFFLDRKLLQGRMNAAVEFIRGHPKVDPTKMAAIGFCFGGLAVYELLRSGADIQAVVCFHGIYSNEREGQRAKTTPVALGAKAKLLLLQGAEDPFVSDADLKFVQKEMTEAKIDWQLHVFGHTMHGFTNPIANSPEKGTVFNPLSADRAWRMMQIFLESSVL